MPASWHEALAAVAEGMRGGHHGRWRRRRSVWSGGARLTNEGAYAWAKLAKGVVGTDSVDAQLGDGLPAELVRGPAPGHHRPGGLGRHGASSLSGDVREELPVLFLRLRSAVVDGELSLVELSPQATSLTAYAKASLRYAPGEATAAARALVDPSAPGPGLRRCRRRWPRPAGWPAPAHVVVIAGRPSLAEDGALVAEAVQVLAAGVARRPVPARPPPGQRQRRPRHGAGPGAAARPGHPRRRAATGSPTAGVRSRRPGVVTPRASCGPRPAMPDAGARSPLPDRAGRRSR